MSSSTSSSRGLVVGALTFLVSAGVLEHVIDRFTGSASTNETFLLYRTHVERIDEAPDVDVLFLGDSSVRASIDPQRFEQLTGRRALNLGFVSNAGIIGDLYFLDAHLRRHAAPSVVVLGHAPGGVIEDFPTKLYLDFFARPESAIAHLDSGDLSWTAASDALLRSASRAYRHRDYVASAARPWLLLDFDAGEAAHAKNAAFLEARRTLGFFPADGAFAGGAVAEGFTLSAPHRRALEALRARLPATTRCLWSFGPRVGDAPFDVARVRAALPEGIELLFERPPVLDERAMADAVHANALGAEIVTASVARALNARPR